jgi:putative protease
MDRSQIELLAPARDLVCGRAAIDCGADAIYVGAARFGARAQAGNSLDDIEALVCYAHTYWARVYVTVNTLLYDHELPQAVRLIHRLYESGVDALIVQDMGLLECDLPPLPLIASTQMHNDTPQKVAFLERVGFRRAILARELSLDQIGAIRRQTNIELESFVHGALCVCYSGQCYMSYAVGGRSGNRGQCAQPCRRLYSLIDRNGKRLTRDRHLLSLKDLNLSDYLGDLIDAGVCSFKIEGRLKDRAYVTNVVSHYRRQLDRVLEAKKLTKSSSGQSEINFEPDVTKTFNRGYTTYFDAAVPGAIDTPKKRGELVGQVVSVTKRSFTLTGSARLHNGDGLCFFDASGELRGSVVTAVRDQCITVERTDGIREGTSVYRNHDHVFLSRLNKSRPDRRIAVRLRLEETTEGLRLIATDADGNVATGELACDKISANKPDRVRATTRRQLSKMGRTEFRCSNLEIAWQDVYFVPLSELNGLRRRTLETLSAVRAQNRPLFRGEIVKNNAPYPVTQLTYTGNVLNQKAAAFYRRHGVTAIAPAAESGLDMRGKQVMRTRYCLKHQLDICPRDGSAPSFEEPLYLIDQDGHRYELCFNCAACEMEIFLQDRGER